jgi:hypothetical protein
MSGFVDEARREWKRLGVPDLAADEMADDLRADIEEAERDGASAADLLGASVNDPRGFAAAWASERGLVPLGRERRRLGRRWWIAAAVLAVAAVAIIGVLTAHVTKSRKIIITRAGHAPLANQIQQLAAQQQQSRIIGTEVYSVLLLPGNVKLSEDTVPKRVGRPSEIAVLVKNTGGSPLAQVHVLLRLGAAYTASGETGPLRPSFVRYVRFRIPRTLVLSANLLIGASTLPVPGERNLSNNRRIWHVRLRP